MMLPYSPEISKIITSNVTTFLVAACTLQAISASCQTDTLAYARSMADTGAFQAANDILEQYNKHNHHVEALLLQAQVLERMDSPGKAEKVYKKALQRFPTSPEVKLRYGTRLFEVGKWRKSKPLLEDYAKQDTANQPVQIKLGWIALWAGRTKVAKDRVNNILHMNPENEDAKALLAEINRLTSPYIYGEFTYLTDDQPHNRQRYRIGLDWYVSRLFAPNMKLGVTNFDLGDSLALTRSGSIGNNFQLPGIGLRLKATVGLLQYQQKATKTLGTWELELSQHILKSLRLEAGLGVGSYQHTLRSFGDSKPLMQQVAGVKLVLDHKSKWLGEAAYLDQHFLTDQHVKSYYAWGVVSPLMTKTLTLYVGYAYSYKHSDTLTYQPLRDEMGQPIIDQEGQIEGIYDPYFSPINQHIHDVLATLQVRVGNHLTWIARTSFGFWSQSSIPYLFQDVDQNQNVFVNSGTVAQRFYPWVLENIVRWKITPLLEFSFQYTYQELFFYKSHTANARIQYQLPHE